MGGSRVGVYDNRDPTTHGAWLQGGGSNKGDRTLGRSEATVLRVMRSAAGWYVRGFSLQVFVIAEIVSLASCEAIACLSRSWTFQDALPSGPTLPEFDVLVRSGQFFGSSTKDGAMSLQSCEDGLVDDVMAECFQTPAAGRAAVFLSDVDSGHRRLMCYVDC
jgi:hypothetical protein